MSIGARRLQRGNIKLISRDALVAGVDKPDSTNTGPYTVRSWQDVYPPSGTTVITLTSPGTYYGMRFWGRVKWSVANVIFRECIFAGPDPTSWSENTAPSTASVSSYGCTQNYGSTTILAEIWDSRYDPSEWLQSYAPGGAKSKLNRYNIGHHGGNVRLYRTEIKNVSDGINFIGPSGSTADANAHEFLMQQCWLHLCLYGNNLYPPDDGQPHCDGFQTNYGKNITIRGNTIGGVRETTGYNIWPGGYNTGDDFWNSCFQLSQEIGGHGEAIEAIENVLIELNWLAGGSSSINHASKNAFASTFNNTIIRNNRFMRRQPGWEKYTKPTKDSNGKYIAYSDPVHMDLAGGYYGTYVLRPTAYSSMYSGNVYEDNGTAVPISQGS